MVLYLFYWLKKEGEKRKTIKGFPNNTTYHNNPQSTGWGANMGNMASEKFIPIMYSGPRKLMAYLFHGPNDLSMHNI